MVQAEKNDQDLMAQYTLKLNQQQVCGQEYRVLCVICGLPQLSCQSTDIRRWFLHYRLIH